MALFALDALASATAALENSDCAERIWLLVHSNLGPVLIRCWYIPPAYAEIASIVALDGEWNTLSEGAVGAILLGDMARIYLPREPHSAIGARMAPKSAYECPLAAPICWTSSSRT